MEIFLSFTVVGLVAGCVYALIATGLVVTYNTTGIFNFAHGAIAMVGAYTYWQFTDAGGWGLNPVLSLVVILFVLAPLFGVVIERVLMRPLRGAPVDLTLVVTLGLLLFLVGVAQLRWDPSQTRNLVYFFNGSGFRIGYVLVYWHDVVAVAATVAIAIGLRFLFNQTRTGIAMRAVVDNADLLAMAGGQPVRVQQLSWALSCSLAALAGILLAPIARLDIILLTLLVVDGYAAAIIGRLRSLPLAVGGAMAIGLGQYYLNGYVTSGFLHRVQFAIPMVVLFVMLIVLPQDRLKSASFTGAVAPRVAGLTSSLVWGGILIAGTALLGMGLSDINLRNMASGFILALVLLSLMLLTGYGGMVSICQMAFVGLGAMVMGHVAGGGSLLGVVAAIGACAGAGFILALPTLKMRGLYLALATFAFATVMDQVVFNQAFGTGGSLAIGRPHLLGIPTQSDYAFCMLCCVIFAIAAVAVLAVRRSSFGRRLVAVNDSPAACATLGVNVNWTKLVVFTSSAALCGLAGALVGGVTHQVQALQFAALLSLVALLLARVGGINTATGVLLGAFVFAFFGVFLPHLPHFLQSQFLLTGFAAVSVGRDPNGMGGRIADLAARLRKVTGREPAPAYVPSGSTQGTAAAVFLEEEGGLVHAGR
ncbi:MAG: ABC transporter permease [Frankiales bacterium]|nr:ABC transporter permease [Frankiales bacterium]